MSTSDLSVGVFESGGQSGTGDPPDGVDTLEVRTSVLQPGRPLTKTSSPDRLGPSSDSSFTIRRGSIRWRNLVRLGEARPPHGFDGGSRPRYLLAAALLEHTSKASKDRARHLVVRIYAGVSSGRPYLQLQLPRAGIRALPLLSRAGFASARAPVHTTRCMDCG